MEKWKYGQRHGIGKRPIGGPVLRAPYPCGKILRKFVDRRLGRR